MRGLDECEVKGPEKDTAESSGSPLINECAKISHPPDRFVQALRLNLQRHREQGKPLGHLCKHAIRKNSIRKPLLMPRIPVAGHSKLSSGVLCIVAGQVDLFERIERHRRLVPINSKFRLKEAPVRVEPTIVSLPLCFPFVSATQPSRYSLRALWTRQRHACPNRLMASTASCQSSRNGGVPSQESGSSPE